MKSTTDPAQPEEPKTTAEPTAKIAIRKLPTGVRGLDDIFCGGIPEYSFNIIAGTPGCGKTTMAHQIAFANGTEQNPSLYFTVLGESALKMVRYSSNIHFTTSRRWVNPCVSSTCPTCC
jgi:circadian clock protein KaiC